MRLDLRWRGRDRQAARVNGRCHAARAPTYRAAWLNRGAFVLSTQCKGREEREKNMLLLLGFVTFLCACESRELLF